MRHCNRDPMSLQQSTGGSALPTSYNEKFCVKNNAFIHCFVVSFQVHARTRNWWITFNINHCESSPLYLCLTQNRSELDGFVKKARAPFFQIESPKMLTLNYYLTWDVNESELLINLITVMVQLWSLWGTNWTINHYVFMSCFSFLVYKNENL